MRRGTLIGAATRQRGRIKSAAAAPSSGGGIGLRWSSTATWGGALPTAGDAVVIPNGQTYTLDMTGAVAQSITVNGTLNVDPAVDVSLAANWINVSATGALVIGEASSRYTRSAVITLNGPRASGMPSNRFVADVTATSGAGNGRLARLFGSTGAVAETITVSFTSATAFNVVGSVSGSLGSGTTGALFNNKVRFIATPGGTPWANGHTVTLIVEQRAFSNAGVQRGLQVMPGGTLKLYGASKTARTRLNAHASAGASSFTLADAPSGWAAGDEIGVGPTDYRDTPSGQSQKLVLQSAPSGTGMTTTATLTASRWGLLQYATDAGPSSTPGTLTKPADTPQVAWDATPKVLDERAAIVNLTRNIVIAGANDADWTGFGFGAHVMVMGQASVVQVDGVEFRRSGQRGILGRYPFHWHMSSYATPDGMTLPTDGAFLGSVGGQFIRNCSINGSENRAIVIHATHGAEVSDCVAYDIRSHAYFLEEGSEESNTIQRNVAMKVRTVASSTDALVRSDTDNGAAGFWLSNSYNSFEDNWAFECDHWGIVNAWGMTSCIGQSQEVAIVPRDRTVLLHRGNEFACNGVTYAGFSTASGMATSFPHINNRGETADRSTGVLDDRLLIEGAKGWKNMPKNYFNRVITVRYMGWTVADNERIDFVGQASDISDVSFGDRCLFFAESLNNANSRAAATIKSAVASYHELLFFKDSIFVNYVQRAPGFLPGDSLVPVSGGVVQLNDLYTDSEFTFAAFTGLKMVNSVFGTRVRPPHLGDGNALGNRHWSFAGAIRDVNGSIVGAGRTWIYDVPFLTYDAADLQTPSGTNEKSTTTRYYGMTPYTNVEPSSFSSRRPIDIKRMDPANADITGTNSAWTVGDGAASPYVVFRHVPLAKNGRYRVLWPGDTVTWLSLSMAYAELASDSCLLAIQFNGASVASAFLATNPGGAFVPGSGATVPSGAEIAANEARMLTSAANLAAVEAGSGNLYWHDSANSRVWVKYVGGLTRSSWPGGDAGAGQKLHTLCIKA